MSGIAGGISSASSALGGAGAAGAGAASAFPWAMAAQMGIGTISALTQPKFQLQENSTLEDAKAHAKNKASQIPLIGGLLANIAERRMENKWSPVFENREAKDFERMKYQADTAKMDALLQQRMDRLQNINLFKDFQKIEPWQTI